MNSQNEDKHFTPLPQRLLQVKSHLNILLFGVVVMLSLVVLGGTVLLVMKKSSNTNIPAQITPTAQISPITVVSPTPKATDSATINTSPETVDVGSIEADLQDLDRELQGL